MPETKNEIAPNAYFVRSGVNAKMSDVSAVYILQHLNTNYEKIIKVHQELYQYTKQKIQSYQGVRLFPSFHDEHIAPSCITLLFDSYDDKYEMSLKMKNVFCRKYYFPLLNTPISVKFFNAVLCVPCTIDMTLETIDMIFSTLFE